MTDGDKAQFAQLISDVMAFYRRDCSPFATSIWWTAMKPFDFQAVRHAFNRHCVDPDRGQFEPKPADLIRLLQGGGKDGAALAWAKVERAVRVVGTYRSVAFDDPIIHAVVSDLGGWVFLGRQTEDEWPFLAKRFETLYQGYRLRGGVENYPAVLIGISEADNTHHGYKSEPPLLLGEPAKAALVLKGGGASGMLQVTQYLPSLPARPALTSQPEHFLGDEEAEDLTPQD